MSGIAFGLLMFLALTAHTPYWYVLISMFPLVGGIGLAMSPMTASIMSAVPARRAGAGSAMNDGTRELGAALGIAFMGSLAASRYTSSLNHATTHLPASVRHTARISLANALSAAAKLGGPAGHALRVDAQHAFLDGIQLAVIGGAILSATAATVVYRRLPRRADVGHPTDLAAAGSAGAGRSGGRVGRAPVRRLRPWAGVG